MKNLPSIITTAICTLLLFSTVVYTSCKKDCGVCEHGGVCKKGNCECSIYYEGPHCEIKRDPCQHNLCQNGGACADGKCQCPIGSTGEYCETLSRKRFIADWEGVDDCTSMIGPPHIIRILADPTATGIRLYNIRNRGFDVVITGAFTTKDIVHFKDQDVGKGQLLNGDLYIQDTVLRFSYTIMGDSSGENCRSGYRLKRQ